MYIKEPTLSTPADMDNPDRQDTIEITSRSLYTTEALLIRIALERTGWNLLQASRLLEISRGSLYSKIEKYRIKKPSGR